MPLPSSPGNQVVPCPGCRQPLGLPVPTPAELRCPRCGTAFRVAAQASPAPPPRGRHSAGGPVVLCARLLGIALLLAAPWLVFGGALPGATEPTTQAAPAQAADLPATPPVQPPQTQTPVSPPEDKPSAPAQSADASLPAPEPPPEPDPKQPEPAAKDPPSPQPPADPVEPAAEPEPEPSPAASAEEPPSYEAIDRHALAAPRQAEQSLERLAAYLTRPAQTDREKVRAVYRWVTARIAYDADSFFAGRTPDDSPRGVLRARRAVCSGYANLFAALCKQAGVRAVRVVGKARGYGERTGGLGPRDGHAWNAVRLEGRWWLLDATWGAGHLDGRKFVRRFSEHYFLTPPDQLIFTHLPDNARWQLLPRPLTAQQFVAQPRVDRALFEMGVKAAAIRAAAERDGSGELVKTFQHPGGPVRLRRAPLERHLQVGKAYRFRIEAADFAEVAVNHQGRWHPLTARDGVFEGVMRPSQGLLRVSVRPHGQERVYWTVLEYLAE